MPSPAETLKRHGIRAENEQKHTGGVWSYNNDRLRVKITRRYVMEDEGPVPISELCVVHTPYAEGEGRSLDEACADFVDTLNQYVKAINYLLHR